MENTTNKVVVIGAGYVGTSFLYAAINQNLAKYYGIIDLKSEFAHGQKLDLEDGRGSIESDYIVEDGGYELLKDADLLIIAAGGGPLKPGGTRHDLLEGTVKIMKSIAVQVKASGFKGITIIASAPLEAASIIYQHITGIEPNKVISASCVLDSSRLKIELSKLIENAAPKDFDVYIMGEHGDSSVAAFSAATLKGVKLSTLYEEYGLTEEKLAKVHETVWKKAYEIFNRKGLTSYGIGMVLVDIACSVLRDEKRVFATGALLSGEYGIAGTYAAIPCLIGKEGIIRTFELDLSEKEKAKFIKSISILKELNLKAFSIIREEN